MKKKIFYKRITESTDHFTQGKVYHLNDDGFIEGNLQNSKSNNLENFELVGEGLVVPGYYNNENGSIYKFCNDQSLNAWESDIVKRVVRCRNKGEWRSDLEKTKVLIDLYLKEYTP